jgi:hypothetical protein
MGARTREPTVSIDYKALKKVNAEVARKEVAYLNAASVSSAARLFGITREVVYSVISREQDGDLKDRPRCRNTSLARLRRQWKKRALN